MRKKIYGSSRVDGCPFCGKQSTTQNEQKIPVCLDHKKAVMGDMKCICGNYLDILQGKYGYFFSCMTCGPQNQARVFEINEIKDISDELDKEEKKSHSSINSAAKASNPYRAKKKKKKQVQYKPKSAYNSSQDSDFIKLRTPFKPKSENSKKETIVTSDDPMYFS